MRACGSGDPGLGIDLLVTPPLAGESLDGCLLLGRLDRAGAHRPDPLRSPPRREPERDQVAGQQRPGPAEAGRAMDGDPLVSRERPADRLDAARELIGGRRR